MGLRPGREEGLAVLGGHADGVGDVPGHHPLRQRPALSGAAEQQYLIHGTDGVSFGFLNEDRTIDKNRCQEFLENVKNEGRKATFHRAFDCTRDPYEAIETLIDLGFDRLLTSGQEATAEEGIHLLADLQKKYGNQIEIIAGCGVNENNAQKIIDKTGIKQLHSTCRGWGVDATGMGERVSFQVSDEDGDRYRSVSVDRIKKFVQICG